MVTLVTRETEESKDCLVYLEHLVQMVMMECQASKERKVLQPLPRRF